VKKLKIGAHKYKLRFTDIRAQLDSNDCGDVDKEKGFVNMDETLMKSEQVASIIHEVFHIVNSELNHELLESLSQQWTAFLMDNKLLKVEKLLKEEG